MIKRIIQFDSSIKGWIRKNRLEAIAVALVILVGAFFRLYKIDEYMIFLGDEGRDAIIVRRLWTDFDLILIGPRTSIGDMYLGPLYYYLIAPALLLANFSPAGPSIMIALIGVVTLFLLWYVAREWFPTFKGDALQGAHSINYGALIAAGLYAISPTVITYSRSSWNPNVMPFFALVSVYAIWRAWKKSDWKWLIVLGVSFAFILQSHYLGLLLAPAIGLFWLLTLFKIRKTSNVKRLLQLGGFVKNSLIGFGVFLFLMSPLVLFDARHGWNNFAAMKKFFTERQTTVSARPWTAIPEIPDIAFTTNSSLLGSGNEDLTWIATYGLFFMLVYILIKKLFANRKIEILNKAFWLKTWELLNKSYTSELFLVTVWLLSAYIGLGLYKQHIYDHYFGFFFVAPFLLTGAAVNFIYKKFGIWVKLFTALIIIYAVCVNLSNSVLKHPPNRQMQRTQEVAEKIKEEANSSPLNLAVIAERNYEDAYQYFLEKWRAGVVEIDPQKPDETITDQLFVVCELADKNACDPTHNPKAEVANFGWSQIDGEWQVSGVTLYKLVHTDL